MAEATTQITVTPKQLGKHLRSIRRKKGLSLSEVARGAGLSRRELVAYERGKVPIPENDLWVLAGSCGVDVGELLPPTSTTELTAAANATSIGDTVTQLRQSQADAGIAPYLHTLQKLQALPPGKRIPVKERELEDIANALGSTPRSIEQRLQEVLHVSPDEAERLRAMILVPPSARGKPRALAAAPSVEAAAAAAAAVAPPAPAPAPEATPTPFVAAPAADEPPDAPVATPDPSFEPLQTLPADPTAFSDQPLDAPVDPVHGHNVDVFEELARLPDPLPLGDPSAPVPDLLSPPDPFAGPPLVGVPALGPPEGTVELVDSAMPATTGGLGGGDGEPPEWNAADAPPIDVAMRQGSSTWDLGEAPLTSPRPAPDAEHWDTGWTPPAPEGTAAVGFWESTDDWAPATDDTTGGVLDDQAVEDDGPVAGGDDTVAEPTPFGATTWPDPTWSDATWSDATWDAGPWPSSPAAGDGEPSTVTVDPWRPDEWPREPADLGAWDHQPDPAAVDSGFYVDWGTPETDTTTGWDAPATSTWAPVDAGAPSTDEEPERDAERAADSLDPSPAEGADVPAFDPADLWAPAADATDEPVAADTFAEDTFAGAPAFETPVVDEPFAEETFVDEPGPSELAPISWHADDDTDTTDTTDTTAHADTTAADAADDDGDATDAPAPAPAPEPEPDVELAPTSCDHDDAPMREEFVTAGPDWQLGNALPLVEVRGQGGLVMRRADERWALADVTTASDFVAEVEVDFRSGPGLGVLFRASTDEEGRMSGYSFDIDPIYDGGGYLVRQWHADRELWNPIARVNGDDPTSMYGALVVRLEVVGEHLRALVNGAEVLTVENLKQASADRGRDAATGDRVGVQAWSSSDLVIDTVRVAAL